MPFGATHPSYDPVGQIEAAYKNPTLVVPEIVFETASGAIGTLSRTDSFHAFLGEALADVADDLGGRGIDDVGELIIASHSGAYAAASAILDTAV